ncbi:BUD13 homolog [Panonychus citri]|uniref:BUD13 homolog n=1 Tax=Panonychus citri TaxID=50023 RepID=UPI002306E14D|nr:BUD13 homolog [Panonychus citri]
MSSKSLIRPVDHKEYLRIKYGDGDHISGKVKKKKKKGIDEISKGTNLRIYDDDIEMQKVKSKKVTDDLDIYFGVDEDKPVIQDIIDDRPTAAKNRDKQGSKWRPVGSVDDEETTDKNRLTKDSRSSKSTKKDKKKDKVKHGITSAAEMREERKKLKEQEAQMFRSMDPKISGKGAKSVYRDKKTGRIRDLEKEEADAKARKEELEAKTAKERQKFKEMTVGIKQVEEEKKRIEEEEKVMAKPLARYEDDADFDEYCAQQGVAGDPMLAYLNEKEKEKAKEKESETDDKKKAKIPWRGSVQAPPNRFNILPGHRWDGVDRSNGYEQKYFARLAEKEATKEEAYRWSTEDM